MNPAALLLSSSLASHTSTPVTQMSILEESLNNKKVIKE
jgi:hypothetical protein